MAHENHPQLSPHQSATPSNVRDSASGAASAAVKAHERRRARRVRLTQTGKFLLSDGGEHSCSVVDASVTGLALKAHMIPRVGERIIAYIGALGRLEGVVVYADKDGFALELAGAARSDRLAHKLANITQEAVDLSYVDPDRKQKRKAELRIAFGQTFVVEVADETREGARVVARFRLLPGAYVYLNGREARVMHDTADGFTIAYTGDIR